MAVRQGWCWSANNNNVIIISKTMFMVLLSWQAIARVHPVHLMNVEWCQVAIDPRPSQMTWAVSLPLRLYRLPESIPTIANRYLLLLLSSKADSHFTIPRRVEGWVNLVGWLHTEMVYPPTDGHQSWYRTNRVWRSATTLIEAYALPLSQTAKSLSAGQAYSRHTFIQQLTANEA